MFARLIVLFTNQKDYPSEIMSLTFALKFARIIVSLLLNSSFCSMFGIYCFYLFHKGIPMQKTQS